MNFSWSILGYGVLVGIACFIVFRGMDLFLEWWLDKRLDRDLKNLNAVDATATRAERDRDADGA